MTAAKSLSVRSTHASRLLIIMLLLLAAGQGDAALIVIDGGFDDWGEQELAWSDSLGDGAGIDFGRLWVAGDTNRLYLCFETGGEMGLQGGNAVRLFIDADDDPETGRPVDGMGVDLEWTFGEREGRIHREHGEKEYLRVEQSDVGLRQGPTVTSDVFEISITRSLPSLRLGGTLRIALHDAGVPDGDRLPDAGSGVVVVLPDIEPGAVAVTMDMEPGAVAAIPDPAHLPGEASTLARRDRQDLRVLTYNVLFDGLFKRPAPFRRILRAIDPDVICFQELWSHSAQQVADQVSLALPGARWHGETLRTDDREQVSHHKGTIDRRRRQLLGIDRSSGQSLRQRSVYRERAPAMLRQRGGATGGAGRDCGVDAGDPGSG